MKRGAIIGVIAVLSITTLDAKDQPRSSAVIKEPSEWTIEERIAQRTDATLARKRVERYRASERESEIDLKSAPRRFDNSKLVDVIDGKRNPELFLPHELFESLIRKGFVGDTWRDFMVDEIPAAGLPEDFWERLEHVAPAFIDLMLKQHQILEGVRGSPDGAKSALKEASKALQQDLCRERADALARARAEFGPALDRLLYGYIARIRSVSSPWLDNRESLAFEARGCR